jgi:hypothetical protein
MICFPPINAPDSPGCAVSVTREDVKGQFKGLITIRLASANTASAPGASWFPCAVAPLFPTLFLEKPRHSERHQIFQSFAPLIPCGRPHRHNPILAEALGIAQGLRPPVALPSVVQSGFVPPCCPGESRAHPTADPLADRARAASVSSDKPENYSSETPRAFPPVQSIWPAPDSKAGHHKRLSDNGGRCHRRSRKKITLRRSPRLIKR